MALKQYKVLMFDCYGTLVDWESGMLEALKPLLSQSGAPSREEVFERLGPHETRIQTEAPGLIYTEVLKKAYLATSSDLGLEADENAAQKFGDSVGDWPAFPDSADALKKLQDSGLKLVILSNVHINGFASSRKQLESSGAKFDAVYVAQQIGSYKPSRNNFEYALKHIEEDLGITNKDEILIVANSKLHDIEPGRKMGLKGAWINRAKAHMGVKAYSHIHPDFEYDDMASFAADITKQRA